MTQHESRQELLSLLGDLPDWRRPVRALARDGEQREGFVLEKLVLDLNGLEPVPAVYLRPADAEGPLPAVLFNHSHGGFYDVGKDELLQGAPYLQQPPYAGVLTGMGYAVLCIDQWGFGGRHTRSESDIFKEMLWRGRVMWGMMVYDNLRALDYLCSRSDIDADRIATLGMSMGGTMAWWSAALDERIRVCVDIGSMTDFQSLIESDGLSGHSIYYYVPGLLKRFTAARINGLIAPRPHLCLAGDRDALTPPAGLDRIDRELSAVYAEAGAPDGWRMVRRDVDHRETADMRAEIVDFLRKRL